MLDIIEHNPYRILGVYSTSPQREIVANQGRMKAFLHVGRSISFPLDLPNVLPAICRTEDSVKEAAAKLTLPADQLRFAQFWFAKVTTFDDIACAKLTSGDIDGAIGIWSKKDSESSLQNRIVCALIRKQYGEAINCAERLYSNYAADFIKMVLGETATASSDNMTHDFLNVLCDGLGASTFMQYITIAEWKQYVGSKSTQPLIDAISASITTAKANRGKGSAARYNAGVKLMNDTKSSLTQLKQFLSATDLQYQVIADKLGLEILQCGIDYYNDSEDRDAAHKAMVLQKSAQSVVVGKMAKDRCKENVDILNEIIKNLPPEEIEEEFYSIIHKINSIKDVNSLIEQTKDDLRNIKKKLGKKDSFYLSISTKVASRALQIVVKTVNEAQKQITSFEDFCETEKRKKHEQGLSPNQLFHMPNFGSILSEDIDYKKLFNVWVVLHNTQVELYKDTLQKSWKHMNMIKNLDMVKDFRQNQYQKNRKALMKLNNQYSFSSSQIQACVILHIVSIIFAFILLRNVLLGLIVGCVFWACAGYEKSKGEDDLWDSLSRGGCAGILIYLALFVFYWLYKIVRITLDYTKGDTSS